MLTILQYTFIEIFRSEIENATSSISKEIIDANLEESRLKYLQCKLAEILTEEYPVENFPEPIELCFPSPETQSLPHVKFVSFDQSLI